MVQPNYAFQKRQRDLAKKQKKEEKKMKKAGGNDTVEPGDLPEATPPAPPAVDATPP